MKDIVIKDIERKTNFDRETLREAAVTAYDALENDSQSYEAHAHDEEKVSDNSKYERNEGK